MADSTDRHLDRQLDTLFALAVAHWNVSITCRDCQQRRVFEGHQLWWLFQRRGWNEHISAVPLRFYCKTCWSRNCRKGPRPKCERTKDLPDQMLEWPSDREWKRAVTLYRS
jgi:hypothetical protein